MRRAKEQAGSRSRVDGVRIQGDDLPSDVALIPIRPVWQLSNDEERRTRQVDVSFNRAWL